MLCEVSVLRYITKACRVLPVRGRLCNPGYICIFTRRYSVMLRSISQRGVGYLLIASGGSVLTALMLYAAFRSAVANFKLPKFSDDNIKVIDTRSPYRWVTRDEQPGSGLAITVLGDGQWHDTGVTCYDGYHYRFAPSGEFHPFDVNLCGTLYSVTQIPPKGKFFEAYTVTRERFTGTPQQPIVLFSPRSTISVKATSDQTASLYLEISNAQGKIQSVARQQAIENNLGRPPEITGTEFQKVQMPPRWPMPEYLLGSYYLALPKGKWVDTGIKLEAGNHILIRNEGRFYPFQYKVGTRTFGPFPDIKPDQFYESYTVLDGTPLGDRSAHVAPGNDTVKLKVSHDMDMRVEVYRGWAQQ
jgi:hypothetical protein